MGQRTIFSIVKPLDRRQGAEAIAEAVARIPEQKPADRSDGRWTHQLDNQRVVCVYAGDALVISDDAWQFAEFISKTHRLLWMELRMQEGDHWDFTLQRGDQMLANFSTRVRYFNDSRKVGRPWKQGDLQTFADAWGIDPRLVAPYLFDWDRRRTPAEWLLRHKPRRSMPDDKFCIGDVLQILDFMRVIGIAEPFGHPDRFELTIPVWRSVFRPGA